MHPAWFLTTSTAKKAFALHRDLAKKYPVTERWFPPELVHRLLLDTDRHYAHVNLLKILTSVEKRAKKGHALKEKYVLPAIEKMLHNEKFSPEETQRRMSFLSAQMSYRAFKRLMGERELSSTERMVYGGDIRSVTSDSLLGKYLALTGAKTRIQRFPKTNESEDGLGPEKLVVSVSRKSFGVLADLFRRPEVFGHLHTPRQGTLNVVHRGLVGTYSRLNDGAFRFPSDGTIVPLILLNSREASRLAHYFKLGEINDRLARHPWLLEGYATRGGYSCCTHWIGDIPIGDAKTTQLLFPGRVDQYANGEIPEAPQSMVMRDYDRSQTDPYRNAFTSKQVWAATRRVWKIPSQAQLHETLGITDAQVGGELASPGWVIITMTGVANSKRIPIVFWFHEGDHQAPVESDIPTQASPV